MGFFFHFWDFQSQARDTDYGLENWESEFGAIYGTVHLFYYKPLVLFEADFEKYDAIIISNGPHM